MFIERKKTLRRIRPKLGILPSSIIAIQNKKFPLLKVTKRKKTEREEDDEAQAEKDI